MGYPKLVRSLPRVELFLNLKISVFVTPVVSQLPRNLSQKETEISTLSLFICDVVQTLEGADGEDRTII